MVTKICSVCHADKPIDDFFKEVNGRHGRRGRCKLCDSKARAPYKAANREKRNAQSREWHRKFDQQPEVRARRLAYNKQYYQDNSGELKAQQREYRLGITQAQFEALLEAQEGRCSVCDSALKPGKLTHVDHDHACCSGERACGQCVRGVLCHDCNLLLGNAKDSVDRLISAIDYLERHRR